MTTAVHERTLARPRLMGVDVARGIALLGMMAVHSFGTFGDTGDPTAATLIAAGRSAATFAFVAGVGLTFLSGGRTPLQGHRRVAAAAGIVVRGLLITLVGLVLGYLDSAEVILAFYGLMFVLAVPLLGLRTRALALLAAAVAVIGPVLLVATAGRGLPYTGEHVNPTLTTLVENPLGLLALLLATGSYPVLAYMSYVCAGMAVGRLDLSSRRVAGWLVGGGSAAAVLAKIVSGVLLFSMGGMARLIAFGGVVSEDGASTQQTLLWDPHQGRSWWYLALASPHANTPLDLMHTLGVAMAVLGAALLIVRSPRAAQVLRPLADAGSMTLTLYSAHLVLLATGLLDDDPAALYLLMVVAALAFAVAWRRRFGQGPLERPVARAALRTRLLAAHRLAPNT